MIARNFSFIVFLFFTISYFPLFSSLKLENWSVHTSMLNVNSVSMDSRGRFWLGSSGGLIIYDSKNSDTISINHLTGLLDANITKLCYLPDRSLMLIGSKRGFFDIVTEDLEFVHITSIYGHNFSNPTINDILVYGNKVFISGGWGLAEFDMERMIFTKTIEKLGDLHKNAEVNNIAISNDTLWACTAYGVACVPLTQNISIPNNWATYFYPEEKTYSSAKLVKLSNVVYINFGYHIYTLENNEFTIALETDNSSNNNQILDIASYNNDLIYCTPYQVFSLKKGYLFSNWSDRAHSLSVFPVLQNSPTDFIFSFNYTYLGASLIKADFSSVLFTPNSPCVDNFMDLAINSTGKLYAVTDNSYNYQTPGGVMSFDGSNWINYNNLHSDAPCDIRSKFDAISVGPDDRIYAGGWGNGLYIIDETKTDPKERFTVINETNSPMTPFSGTFTIAGETAFDKNNRAWTVNYGLNTGGTFLFTYDNNLTNFIAFTNPFSAQDRKYYNIAIDNYGTKWIYGTNGAEGIIYFNDKNTPEIASDDLWGILSTSNNATMLTNDVNCLAIDNFTSQIWLGTPSGISIIRNPYAINSNSKIIISNLSFLRGQTVLDIIVDVVGNKWIATTSGVFVINREGDDTLGSITMNNSPLTTNEVNALAMNSNNGLLYLGTKQGLYIVQTTILRPDDTYLLKTYPEPFNIDRDLELTIDGLVADSEIRILTPDGRLIRSLDTYGKRTIWDGRDSNGNKVPPGVYIVIGNSSLTKQSAAGKIAVVK